MELQAQKLSFAYGRKMIIEECYAHFAPGTLTVITGPNGCGKSTLIHLLGGLLAPGTGSVTLDGVSLASFSHLQRANLLGVLMQERMPALDFSVRERVLMGRFAALPRVTAPGEKDLARVEEALEQVGMASFAATPCNQLSGGEYQKVLVAALLVRETPVMLLDEPTSALDPAGALAVMRLLQQKKKDTAVAVVTHDLALGAAFADKLLLISQGRIFAEGTPKEVLTADNIASVYHCGAEILASASGVVPVFK